MVHNKVSGMALQHSGLKLSPEASHMGKVLYPSCFIFMPALCIADPYEPPGLSLAIVVFWEVNQQMEDFRVSLSLILQVNTSYNQQKSEKARSSAFN